MYRVILFIFFAHCECFNLSPESAEIISHSASYFGYSVLLRANSSKSPPSVIVGAPKANSSFSMHSKIIEPGAVYSCELHNLKCKQFLFDPKGNTVHGGTNGYKFSHRKDYGWLGSALDGSDVSDGFLVACSPRWINNYFEDQFYLQNGICYVLQSSGNTDKSADNFMPLLRLANQGYYNDNDSFYYYALGESGFSIHVAKNNSEILLGAPGVLQWKGTVLKYYNQNHENNKSILYQVVITNPYGIHKIAPESYFGYSVSSGRFVKGGGVWYVGGAPRGNGLYGQVLLFEYGARPDELLFHYELRGEQFCEYYGAAVAVADVNNDGAHDLLVGAPTHSLADALEVGRLYVHMNDGSGAFSTQKITGPGHRARFASAISAIGDINNDGFQDIVVGAPFYENGQGAIFIYMGNAGGLDKVHRQIIRASDINSGLRTFGCSLSRGVDIDMNNYNDIAVGAYSSGHVVVLRTSPIVQLSGTITSDITHYEIGTSLFQIVVCLRYTGTNVPASLLLNMTVHADPALNRVLFAKDHVHFAKITRQHTLNEQHCEAILTNITNGAKDYSRPLEFTMAYGLVRTAGKGKFCPGCPVVDGSRPSGARLRIPFDDGCGPDSECQPDARLSARFNYAGTALVIGSVDMVEVVVDISNVGEPAFGCVFHLNLTSDVYLEKIPDVCTLQKKMLMCDVDNPLAQGKRKTLVLSLDISSLSTQTSLVLEMEVKSMGVENNTSDNYQRLEMPLTSVSNVVIQGSSTPDEYTYVNSDKLLRSNNVSLQHNFIVENYGPSALSYAELELYVPYKMKDSEESLALISEPVAFLDSQSTICNIVGEGEFFNSDNYDFKNIDPTDLNNIIAKRSTDNAKRSQKRIPDDLPLNRTFFVNCSTHNVRCMQIKCVTHSLKKTPVRLTVDLKILANIKLLDEVVGDKDIIVLSTKLNFASGNLKQSFSLHTLLHGSSRDKIVIKWIILGVVVGVALLGLIIYALYKYGFFKRTAHKKLLNEMGGIVEEEDTISDPEE